MVNIMIIPWILFAIAYITVASIVKETLFDESKNISEERSEPISKSEKLFMRTIAVFWPISVPIMFLCGAIASFFED